MKLIKVIKHIKLIKVIVDKWLIKIIKVKNKWSEAIIHIDFKEHMEHYMRPSFMVIHIDFKELMEHYMIPSFKVIIHIDKKERMD